MKITLTQIANRKTALKNELAALNKAAASVRKKEEHKRLAKIAKIILENDLDLLPTDVLESAMRTLKKSANAKESTTATETTASS